VPISGGRVVEPARPGNPTGQISDARPSEPDDDDNAPPNEPPAEKPKKSDRQKCLRDNYGDVYEYAFDLSPLSLASFAADEITEHLEDELSRQANRNLNSLRPGVSQQIFQTGQRQARMLTQFKAFNGAMALVSAGAFGLVFGANAYCTATALGGS
jgi:hypothetical protein